MYSNTTNNNNNMALVSYQFKYKIQIENYVEHQYRKHSYVPDTRQKHHFRFSKFC